jgi:hypothetical protein
MLAMDGCTGQHAFSPDWQLLSRLRSQQHRVLYRCPKSERMLEEVGCMNNTVRSQFFALAAAIALSLALPSLAQDTKSLTAELQRAQEALDKYKDPIVAVHDGYWSTIGCVMYPKAGSGEGHVSYKPGGMGIHFVNFGLIGQPLDPLKPQVLIYEPQGDKLQLVAAEWLVPATPQVKETPQLFGQKFDGPMEGHHPLMPIQFHHYDLHVWLWKNNPYGLFSPTNPELRCPPGPYTIEEDAPRLVKHN